MKAPSIVRVGFVVLSGSMAFATPPPAEGPGVFVDALWTLQTLGKADVLTPANDQKLKGTLAKALKDSALSAKELEGMMDAETIQSIAGDDNQIDAAELRHACETDVPPSRLALLPPLRAHADMLTTSFDMIDEPHRAAGETLVDWIVKNYQPGNPLEVTAICTGNSRRSILCATMGNIAASYYGLPEIHFHSGGTAPSAFNTRTIAGLRAIGVEIKPTGAEAPRGEPKTANPRYEVRWGTKQGMAVEEFSKLYADSTNPSTGFAALMVCGEADESCPFVKGASARISMPYLDPKIYDGSPYESLKYAERRDDLGRLMLSVMMQAKRRIRADRSPGERR